jgi:hypothetical protein
VRKSQKHCMCRSRLCKCISRTRKPSSGSHPGKNCCENHFVGTTLPARSPFSLAHSADVGRYLSQRIGRILGDSGVPVSSLKRWEDGAAIAGKYLDGCLRHRVPRLIELLLSRGRGSQHTGTTYVVDAFRLQLTNNLKQLFLFLLVVVVFVSSLLGQDQRPNFLIIMVDDQSHDTLTQQFMPNTKAMIADGLICTQFIMPTALCCPSRSSLLTGQYARHHGVWDNSTQLVGPTVANRLHEAGYYTGLIGKYLNSWPGDARPEYDYWTAWIGGYLDPKMNIFGVFLG